MVENRDPAVRLDRGFWMATAVLTVLALIVIFWWVYAPITAIMPEAMNAAHRVKTPTATSAPHVSSSTPPTPICDARATA